MTDHEETMVRVQQAATVPMWGVPTWRHDLRCYGELNAECQRLRARIKELESEMESLEFEMAYADDPDGI